MSFLIKKEYAIKLLPFFTKHLKTLKNLNGYYEKNKSSDPEDYEIHSEKLNTCLLLISQFENGIDKNKNEFLVSDVVFSNMLCLIENQLEDFADEGDDVNFNILNTVFNEINK